MDVKSPYTPAESRPFDDLYRRPSDRDAGKYEDKTTLGHRLRKAAAGMLAALAFEQGASYIPPSGPVPVFVQTVNPQGSVQTAPTAAGLPSTAAGEVSTQAHLLGQMPLSHRLDDYRVGAANPFQLRLGPPGPVFTATRSQAQDWALSITEEHPFGSVRFANDFVLHPSSDAVERIVSSVSVTQPSPVSKPEAGVVKETLRQVYKDVIEELHDTDRVARAIAAAAVSKTVEAGIDKLPELASAVLIVIGVKKRKNKEETPSLDHTAEDLEKINELYAEGVPLTTANIQLLTHLSPARILAALQAGLYAEEWHPAGLSLLEAKAAEVKETETKALETKSSEAQSGDSGPGASSSD